MSTAAIRNAAMNVGLGDIRSALAKRNPDAPGSVLDGAADLILLVAEEVLAMSTARLEAVQSQPAAVRRSIATALRGADVARIGLAPRAVELDEGEGLGHRLGREAGLERLHAYATPLKLEDWAGPVAGAGDLEADLGIKRSTLQDWRRNGAVIGLLKGVRKQVFPLAQFIDGRPVQGLAELQEIIGDPRAAWLWLVEPATNAGDTPIARLRRGQTQAVLSQAREDFA